jgi:hypothetical protein
MINISLNSCVIWCGIYVTIECKIWTQQFQPSLNSFLHHYSPDCILKAVFKWDNIWHFSALWNPCHTCPNAWWIFTTSHSYFCCVTLKDLLMCVSRVAARNRCPRRTSRKNEWSYTSASPISCSGQLFLYCSSRSRLKISHMHNRLTVKY